MNSTVYLFGGLSGNTEKKHFQVPDDYTSNVFRKYTGIDTDGPVMAVAFEKSLAYHIYCRHTANGYFGFGVLLNGRWLKGQQKLLSVFNDAFDDTVSSGKILLVDEKGQVKCEASAIKHNEQECSRIAERLRSIVNTLAPFTELLPVIDVSTNPSLLHRLPDNATDSDWRKDIGKYRSHYSAYGNVKSNFNHILERLQHTIQERDTLQQDIAKIKKTKKQYELIIVLAAVMFFGALTAIAIINDKNNKIKHQLETIQNNEQTIQDNQQTIANQNNTINSQTATIDNQSHSISRLNDRVAELEFQNADLRSELNLVSIKFPMLVSYIEIANTYSGGTIETDYGNTLHSASSRFLTPRIRYTGLESKSVDLKIKWYNTDGTLRKGDSSPYDCSFSQNVYIHKGESQSITLKGWGTASVGYWRSGTYRLEVWYGTVCLASRKVEVY